MIIAQILKLMSKKKSMGKIVPELDVPAVGNPVPRKKNFPARCAGTCVPFPFPHLTTLTNQHQRSESQLTGL